MCRTVKPSFFLKLIGVRRASLKSFMTFDIALSGFVLRVLARNGAIELQQYVMIMSMEAFL